MNLTCNAVRRHRRTHLAPWLAAATLALIPALTPTAAQAAGPFQVVMSGLNNPYGLAFGPDSGLYVAEAGTGNNGTATGPGFVNGNGVLDHFGDTGSVSRLLNGTQTRVITGLASVAGAGGQEATGLEGITFDSTGHLYGLFGLGGTEADRSHLISQLLPNPSAGTTNAGDLGQVVRLDTAASSATPISDLVPYETQNYAANNPGPEGPEANPFALVALPGGGFAASDGGGNVVLKTPAGGGAPSLLTLLPAQPNPLPFGPPFYQSVPTGLVLDSQGNLYAGEFTGFPFPAGAADVLKINPTTGQSSVFASGFTTIVGLTFGSNGDLYVLDQTTNGLGPNPGDAQLFQFDPNTGTKTLLASLDPGYDVSGLTAGPDGSLYISSLGAGPGDGEVLRFDMAPVPEASSVVSLGLLLALGLGGLAVRRRNAVG